MNGVRPPQLFEIGDIVRVVSSPYRECPLSWISDMDNYCGRQMQIIRAAYLEDRHVWSYGLRNCPWSWCENCFESPISDIEESDEDISVLFV